MNWLDVTIIVVLIIGVVWGLKMGVIKAVFSLAGMIAGIILAVRYYEPLAAKLVFISSETTARVVAFAIIIVGILVIARLLAWLLEKAASALMVGWLNRVGGAVFGAVLVGVAVSAALGLWVGNLGMAGAIGASRLALLFLEYFPVISSILPAG